MGGILQGELSLIFLYVTASYMHGKMRPFFWLKETFSFSLKQSLNHTVGISQAVY